MIEKQTEENITSNSLHKELENIEQRVLEQVLISQEDTHSFGDGRNNRYFLNLEEEIILAKAKDLGTEALETCEKSNGNLCKEKKQELEHLIELGNKAIELFLLTNQGLIVSIAKRYKEIDLDDLIQEGNIGLLTAIRKYDYTRGCRFSTHATWWVRAAIYQAYAQQRLTIRLPMYRHREVKSFLYIKQLLQHRLKRLPTEEEIASEMGIDIAKITQIQRSIHSMISLDLSATKDDDQTVGELLPSPEPPMEDVVLNRILTNDILDLISTLPEQYSKILLMRNGFPNGITYSREQIANTLGIPITSIRTLEKNALEALKIALFKQEQRI